MDASSRVRRHIASLQEGDLFCRRNLLYCGNPNAVDMALNKLIQYGAIERLAYGVYWRPKPGAPAPTVEQVAEVKIAAFARTRQESSGNCLNESNQMPLLLRRRSAESSAATLLVYEIDGVASTFRVLPTKDRPGVTVKLVKKAARKMFFDFSSAGRMIKSLWKLGKEKVSPEMLVLRQYQFSPKDRKQFHSSHHWMPGWLSRIVHQTAPSILTGAIQRESIRQGKYAVDGKLILVPRVNPLILQI
jgi:hypothetical protein